MQSWEVLLRSPPQVHDSLVDKLDALAAAMDDYMFRSHVESCKNVIESTSYLEILNYSVSVERAFLL